MWKTRPASRRPRRADLQIADSLMAARRRRYDPAKAEAISARKYKFRKRMLALMTLALIGSATAAYPGDARGMVGLRWLRRSDADVPGLSAPSDADRGTGAPAPPGAARAFAASGWRTQQKPPEFEQLGPVAAAQTGSGGVGDRRRGPDSSPSTTRRPPVTTTCRGRPGSNSPRVGRFLRARVGW